MTTVEMELLVALERLSREVESLRSSETKPNLRSTIEKLDELTAALPETAHPQLRHFLRNKSYEKARHWLEQHREGACRPLPQ